MYNDDEFWEANRRALELEQERRYRGNTSSDSVGKQIDKTSERINQSVNNSGSFKARELSPKAQEMILIGAILFAKFCLWFLYRTAQNNDIDVVGL